MSQLLPWNLDFSSTASYVMLAVWVILTALLIALVCGAWLEHQRRK